MSKRNVCILAGAGLGVWLAATLFYGAFGTELIERAFWFYALNAFLAAVFDIGETDHMGRCLTFRVLPFVSAALMDALDAKLGNLLGQLRLTAWKQRGKLLAPNAPEQIATAQRAYATVGQALQYLIAHLVAVTVVDLFEVIQVEQQKSQRAAIFAGLLELALGALEEVPAVAALG